MPPRPHVKALGAALAAALGFVATTTLVDKASPPYLPVLSPKRAHFEAHRDAYTVVFVGTSVVYRSVVPGVFDAAMRALGRAERAFNYGAPHMTLAEAEQIARRLAAERPPHLTTVVLDLELYADAGEHHYLTARHVAWHTPGASARAIALSEGRSGASILMDLRALGRNVTAVGRLSDRLRDAWDPSYRDAEREEDEVAITEEGYQPLEALRSKAVLARRAAFQEGRADYESALRDRLAHPKRSHKLRAYERVTLEQIVLTLQAAGVRVVLFEGPLLASPLRLTGDVLPKLPLLSFKDPAAHPDLFAFESRFDRGHLTAAMAPVLTRRLAEMYARSAREKAR